MIARSVPVSMVRDFQLGKWLLTTQDDVASVLTFHFEPRFLKRLDTVPAG